MNITWIHLIFGGIRAFVFFCLMLVFLGTSAWYKTRLSAEKVAREQSNAHAMRTVRITEQAWREAVYDISYKAHIKRIERDEEFEHTLAAVRDGKLRLRKKFVCPATDAAAPLGGDATTEGGLHREDVEVLLREANRADEVVDQLTSAQSIIKECLNNDKSDAMLR